MHNFIIIWEFKLELQSGNQNLYQIKLVLIIVNGLMTERPIKIKKLVEFDIINAQLHEFCSKLTMGCIWIDTQCHSVMTDKMVREIVQSHSIRSRHFLFLNLRHLHNYIRSWVEAYCIHFPSKCILMVAKHTSMNCFTLRIRYLASKWGRYHKKTVDLILNYL